MTDGRPQIVEVAKWCVVHQPDFIYQESRPFAFAWTPPIVCDCSATVTRIYNRVGCKDPNGPAFSYDGYGNTDSLAANGHEVADGTQTKPGDMCIFYENGTTVHVSMVIEPGPDPLCMSHGQQSEPAFVRPSQDGRVHKFFTYDTTTPDPAPTPGSPADRARRFMPKGTPPMLVMGRSNPHDWCVFARACGRASGQWPRMWPLWPGGYGPLTHNMVVRFERHENLAPDGRVTHRVWAAWGLPDTTPVVP